MTSSTRTRLLDAAEHLFATAGFDGTSAGQIEERAGFAKRGGTLYKHFPSKDAVLSAVIERHAETVRDASALGALLPLGDLRAELVLLARFVLTELAAEERIHRILERAGDRVPAARDRMLREVVEPGYRASTELVRRWLGDDTAFHDLEAVTMVLLGGLVNLRRNLWTFGRVPLGVDDERAVAAWVQLAEAMLGRRR